MARPNTSMIPVQALEEHITALEAAVLECLGRPRKDAVHAIRTSTRRVEAQLTLLELLGWLPAKTTEAARVGRLLKRLRRAAGIVRDLDVQRELIKKEICDGIAAGPDGRRIRQEGRRLRRALREQRNAEAETLVHLLRRRRKTLPRAVRELRVQLEPLRGRQLSEIGLAKILREWFELHAAPHAEAAGVGQTADLHALRKLAKVARYLGESAPADAKRARTMAARFEEMQEAGGRWHDWMQLAAVAEKHAGRSGALPKHLAGQAEGALHVYRRRLLYRM